MVEWNRKADLYEPEPIDLEVYDKNSFGVMVLVREEKFRAALLNELNWINSAIRNLQRDID